MINMIGDSVTNTIAFINDNSSWATATMVTVSLLPVLKLLGLQLFKVNYERQTILITNKPPDILYSYSVNYFV